VDKHVVNEFRRNRNNEEWKNVTNIGLIGCGRVSELHMCAYRHIPESNVVAVSDINLERAKDFAQKHGIKKAFKDYFDILEMKDLDYVDICTPTSTHAKIACEVAGSGHNILSEKPMARSTADCDKIIQEVSKHRVKMCLCHNQLFTPAVMRAKATVESGEFDPLYFRVTVRESAELIGAPSWTLTAQEGGVLWETGCHSAYLQLHFLKNINEVFAVGHKIKHPVHDSFVVLLHTSNQALGVIEVSWLAKNREVVFDLMSHDGKRMEILDYDYLSEIPEKPPTSFLKGFYSDEKRIVKKWTKSVMENLRNRELSTCLHHYNLISRFIRSIRDDSDPPVKPEDGRKTVELLECIEGSLEKNQPVRIESAAR
jgi:UDP-N-acetyl-2-amino-2-deoxyglucuronate dehydrogenase